jgi:hypothetical protein
MKNIRIELKWALYIIATLLIWMIFERLLGLHDKYIDKHQYFTMIYLVFPVILYVFALREKQRLTFHGQMNFLQGLKSGLLIVLFVSILSPLAQWIISFIITPHYFENVIEYSIESGYFENRSQAEAQFNYKNYAIQSTIGNFMMGLIISAVAAFFISRKSSKSLAKGASK